MFPYLSSSSSSSSTSLSSSSSSDEETFPRPRIFRDRQNPFEVYDEFDFKCRFRLSKASLMNILEIIGPKLEPLAQRSLPVSAINKILITLRFYATGTFQNVIGDLFNVHKSTVCRIIKKVTRYIASLRPQYIHMPRTAAELNAMKQAFLTEGRIPGVLGCIDCTHIPIQSPGGENGEIYRCRKGFFSINVQIVCDSKCIIQDIVACWPGSMHDSAIFDASFLRAQFQLQELEGFLIGDSGYPCRSYLLTPVLHPRNAAERRYNSAHILMRNAVERTNGIWKRRFPCLSHGLRTKVELGVAVVTATAVLHNIAIVNQDETPDAYDMNEEEQFEDDYVAEVTVEGGGNVVRAALINSYFN